MSRGGQSIWASRIPPVHRIKISRREGRSPDQILAAERAGEAFNEDLPHAIGGEIISDFRPRATTRRGRSAAQVDVMTADITARGRTKERGCAIGEAHALQRLLSII